MNYVRELDIKEILLHCLKEDIGSGDITTECLIPEEKSIKGKIIAKEPCVICGLNVASLAFRLQNKNIKFKPAVREGDFVRKGRAIAEISGKAQDILTAERVALNFLSFLSGIATKTRRFIEAVKPYNVKILDTRKTLPGLRLLQKYAVRIGGAFNHRLSLDEMILVKDNHIKIIGGISGLKIDRKYKTEIEVKNLKEFKEALGICPDIIMLDNMSIKDMKKAVKIRKGPLPKLEASGGITFENIREVAKCGVDMISVGDLTHSVKAIDLSLEVL